MRFAVPVFLLLACRGNGEPAGFDTLSEADADADTDTDTDADTDSDTDTDTATAGGVIDCAATLPPAPADAVCAVSGDPQTATHVLLRGDVLADDASYLSGDVLIERGENGLITCVGCNCLRPADLLEISCPDAAISPGLVNAHDHLSFTTEHPGDWGTERFDHRHDWRTGARGHNEIDTDSDNSEQALLWGELRMLLGGATSMAGSSSVPGLLRNLDDSDDNGGLGGWAADYSTFPLGDASGTLSDAGCGAYDPEGTFVLDRRSYLPHIAEGIDEEAQNEFRCLSGQGAGSVDLIASNTSLIHGIGLGADDVEVIATSGARLIWSPRSNVSLYGQTAPVLLYANMGVTIALGPDWIPSGSATMLRELQCADSLNDNHYGGYFDDRDLWLMVTRNGAEALGAVGQLGRLRPGFVGDVTVFANRGRSLHRAVIDARIDDVQLVLRGSVPLTGTADLLTALLAAEDAATCEALDDCVSDHLVCTDGAYTLHQLRAAQPNAYDLTICDPPADEPSCLPLRDDESGDGLIYPVSDPDDMDGDGVRDIVDNCPGVFNPGLPHDGYVQGDVDGDTQGDACDPCPLVDTLDCDWVDPDGDGLAGLDDNCPLHANASQEDGDGDLIGDACDACPAFSSAVGACPVPVYDVKRGLLASGSPVAIEHLLVTGGQTRGVFAQLDPDDPAYSGVDYSGVWIYMPTVEPKPQPGDVITVAGSAQDFFGQWQISDVTGWSLEDSGHPLPAPVLVTPAEVATGGARERSLEAALITVNNVAVTSVDVPAGAGDADPTNEFEVDGSLLVNDYLHAATPFPFVGEQLTLTGLLRYANDNAKLEPRDTTDVLATNPTVTALSPATAYLPSGVTSNLYLAVSLSRASATPHTVDFTCGPAGTLACPLSLLVGAGEQIAPVTLSGQGASAVPGTVTATLGASTVRSEVIVYDDSLPRLLASLDPSPLVLAPDAVVPLTVTLDLPAASAGTPVDLSVATGVVSTPTTVVVPADELSATFDVTAGPAPGADTVTASLGGVSLHAKLDVVDAKIGTGLIFSEYLEGSFGTNKYVEIKNVDPAGIDLSPCTVSVYSNGSGTAGSVISLNSTVLATGDIYLLCNGSFAIGGTCAQSSGALTFNGDDAVELACNGTVYDVIGEIGFDPGSTWGSGAEVTRDGVLRRDCAIVGGDADGTDPFDPTVEWIGGATDDASGLGLDGCP